MEIPLLDASPELAPTHAHVAHESVRAAMSDALIYAELKQLAMRQLRRHGKPTTLNATQLVHEAFLRLARDNAGVALASRAHLLNLVSLVMRQLICDFARNRIRRDQHLSRDVPADVLGQIADRETTEARSFLELDACLTELERRDPRQAQVVTCRFFAGLSEEETAEALALSLRTVQRLWADARSWLKTAMSA